MSVEVINLDVVLQPMLVPHATSLGTISVLCTASTEVTLLRFWVHSCKQEPVTIYTAASGIDISTVACTTTEVTGKYYEFPSLTNHLAAIGAYMLIEKETAFLPAITRDNNDDIIAIEIPMTYTVHSDQYVCSQCKNVVYASKKELLLHLIPPELHDTVLNIEQLVANF